MTEIAGVGWHHEAVVQVQLSFIPLNNYFNRMSEVEDRRVALSVNDILQLAGLIDRERERIQRAIDQHPSDKIANEHRQTDIARLDRLTRLLMAQIG